MLAAPAAIALLGSVPMHRHHGNPEDLDSYVAKMEDPSRAEWQKPDEVLRVLGPALAAPSPPRVLPTSGAPLLPGRVSCPPRRVNRDAHLK